MRPILMLGCCMVASDSAQALLKYGLMKIGGFDVTAAHRSAEILKLFHSPHIWAGFLLWGLGSLLWLTVLSTFRFSSAILYFSLHYITLMLIAAFVFKEHISPIRWLGAAFIIAGVILVSRN